MLDQELYVDKALATFGFTDVPGSRTPMISEHVQGPREEHESRTNHPYLGAVGTLLYLATSTRPDISFTIGMLASYCSYPTDRHWEMVVRLFRYVKATKAWGIDLSPKSDVGIEGYSDADYAGDTHSRKSVSGMLVKVYGSPVIWLSRKQKSISRSTQEAEYMAASHTTQQLLYVKHVMKQLGEKINRIPLYIDNTSTISAIVNGAITERTKHIDIAYKIARDMHAEGVIEARYLNSGRMPADLLTKGLTKDRMMDLMEKIGMVEVGYEGKMGKVSEDGSGREEELKDDE